MRLDYIPYAVSGSWGPVLAAAKSLSPRAKSSPCVPTVEVVSDRVFDFSVEKAIEQCHAETLKHTQVRFALQVCIYIFFYETGFIVTGNFLMQSTDFAVFKARGFGFAT